MKRLFSFLMAAVLAWGLVGCSNLLPFGKGNSSTTGIKAQQALDNEAANLQAGQLSEVAPPPVIQELSEDLEAYQPQVTIVSPQTDEVVADTTVSVEFQVQDLPIFKNPDLGLGPHLHVILDNQPYQAVYNLNQPLVLENLSPGTHSLRVFASRPWHESFKNEGAYAQTTFHVLAKSTDNTPDPALPLLTYSRPTGSYGAEPIMLDFYLTNAPLHLVAQENPDDEIADWRIRVTLNGESFVLDRWQPVYLKGLKPGKNWVKLEFLDEQGNPVKNVFNETLRVISYEPNGQDTLSKLVRGELSAEAARGIVDPNYKLAPPSTPTPGEIPAPSPSPSQTVTPAPIPPIAPSVEVTPTPEPETPSAVPTSPIESLPTPEPEASPTPSEAPAAVEAPTPTPEPTPPAPAPAKQSWFGGFFNRFRRPAATPSPAPERLEQDIPTPPPAIAPLEPQQTPEPEASPAPSDVPATAEEPTPTQETTATTPPSESPTESEVLETPSTEPTSVPEEPESSVTTTPQPEESVSPSESPAVVEEPTPTETPTRRPPAAIIQSWFKGLFNRVSPPTTAPSPAPIQLEPEIITPVPAIAPQEPEQTPAPEEVLPTPSESPAAIEAPTFTEETIPSTPLTSPEVLETPTEETTPSTPPASPEVLETPSTEPILIPETLESPAAKTSQPEESVSPSTPPEESTTPDVAPVTIIEPVPVRPIQPEESNTDEVLPTLPELIEKVSPEPSEPEDASSQPEPTQELSPAIPQETAPSELPSDTASVTSEPESPIDNQS